MIYRTAKTDGIIGDAQRAAVDAAVRSYGGSVRWHLSARAHRSYALLGFADARNAAGAGEAVAGVATAYDCPVIALAVFPEVSEALPPVIEALGAPGRPDGIRTCEPCANGGAVVEWDLDRTAAGVVLGLIDLELRRFASGRTAELLTPLSPDWLTRIAADGLQASEISQDRVLEFLLERAGLRV